MLNLQGRPQIDGSAIQIQRFGSAGGALPDFGSAGGALPDLETVALALLAAALVAFEAAFAAAFAEIHIVDIAIC